MYYLKWDAPDKSLFKDLWEKSEELCAQCGEVHEQLETILA
jgi:hypothetical protein